LPPLEVTAPAAAASSLNTNLQENPDKLKEIQEIQVKRVIYDTFDLFENLNFWCIS